MSLSLALVLVICDECCCRASMVWYTRRSVVSVVVALLLQGLYGVVYKEICGECCACIVVAGPLWCGVQGDL